MPSSPSPSRPAPLPEPTLEAQLAVWRSLAGIAGDREEQFRHALEVPVDDSHPSLWGLALELLDAQRYDELANVCVDALLGPIEYDDHWTDLTVFALTRANRYDEARARLVDALFQASLYGAARLMLGLVAILEHEGQHDDARAVFHGASKIVISFSSSAKQHGVDPKRYGRSSAALRRRFAELWDAIVRPRLDVTTIPDTLLWGAERNLREVGCNELADRVASEHTRRNATAPPEPEGRHESVSVPLLAKPAREATDEDFAAALALLPSLEEQQRTLLLDWVYAAVGESRERGQAMDGVLPRLPAPTDPARREGWLESLNNAAVMTWHRKQYELSRALVEAAAPFAHEYPAIFHAGACTYVSLGELEKAFAQVVLAVEHHYEELGQLKRDPDLGVIRTWPQFKELFARRRR